MQIGSIREISYIGTFVLPEFLYHDVYMRSTNHRTVTFICTHRVCVSTVVQDAPYSCSRVWPFSLNIPADASLLFDTIATLSNMTKRAHLIES